MEMSDDSEASSEASRRWIGQDRSIRTKHAMVQPRKKALDSANNDNLSVPARRGLASQVAMALVSVGNPATPTTLLVVLDRCDSRALQGFRTKQSAV